MALRDKNKRKEKTMNENTTQDAVPAKVGQYRPNLAFYHANAKGTGCALKLSLHPAHDDTDGDRKSTRLELQSRI